MASKASNVLLAIIGVATITTVLLPGRQTPAVINSFGNAFSGAIRASMGQR